MSDVITTLPEQAFDALKRECEPYTLADEKAVRKFLTKHTRFDFSEGQLKAMRHQLLNSARAIGQIAHILLELEPRGSGEITVDHVEHAFQAVQEHCVAGLPPKVAKGKGKACMP
jgi:hypothetical protein